MTSPPAWTGTALRYLGPVLVLLLVVEAALGVATNVNGPANFTSQTQFPSLMAHEGVGYLLGLAALIALVAAALQRRVPAIALSLLVLVGVGAAGASGREFIQTDPNANLFSALMAVMFVVALAGAVGMTLLAVRSMRATPPTAQRTASG
jgi:hypothetical protein